MDRTVLQHTKQRSEASLAKRTRTSHTIYATPFPALSSNPLLPFAWLSYLQTLFFNRANYIQTPLKANYDPLSQTIWVRDSASVVTLWRQGFFGKGSLSRSEPTWWIREQNARGYGLKLTAEELTAIRRSERKEQKKVKALEKLNAAMNIPQTASTPSPTPSIVKLSPKTEQILSVNEALPWDDSDNLEHLQLEPVEALYLVFALGSLQLYLPDSSVHLTIQQTYTLLLLPYLALTQPSWLPSDFLHLSPPVLVQRDDDFLVKYVAYHHFRSLGWVVRSGAKFCTDYVLYKGSDGQSGRGSGPVGGHAEFSVIVLKSYQDPNDSLKLAEAKRRNPHLSDEEVRLLESAGEGDLTWKWFSTVNRVTAGVKKVWLLSKPITNYL